MAAVTQTIRSYLGGVSNQPDDKKLPGQVTEAINAYPDPTFGLTKRPGFKFISELTASSTALSTTVLDNSKWFYYNRDDDERYIGCIAPASGSPYGQIYVWNAVTYAECSVSYTGTAREYLGKKESADAIASTLATHFDVLTIRDTTIITNKNRVVTAVAGAAHTDNQVGTVRIHLTEYSAPYAVTIHPSGGSAATYTVNTRAGDTASSDADTTNFLNATTILTSLKTLIDAASIANLTVTVIGSSLEISRSSGTFTLTAAGGKGGNALTSYQNTVEQQTELASDTVHNRVVAINNTASQFDTYYSKFVANNGTSGAGYWVETLKPGESTGVTAANMPHKLYNTAKNAFTFGPITWVARQVGDDNTNEDPSFVNTTIQQAFFYNNRLGFLTEDNVSMSKAASFYDFYMTSAQVSTDADPIDISCSSTRPANLHAIIPSASGLLLFSQDQQFVMFSADGNLKPSTALIRTLSNYKMDKDIDPVDLGTQVNFLSKTHSTAGFVRVFGMVPRGNDTPIVVDIGRMVAEYVPVEVDSLVASTQNSFIAMYGRTSDKIYFYRTYSDGKEDLMQTWFNWQLPGNAHYVTTDSDTMYSVIKTGGTGSDARYNLCSATMTQTPEETIIVTADGQQVNPHMDFYKATTAVSQYPVESVAVTAGGSGYSGTPTVTIAAPASGTQATATATVSGNAVTAITITNPGKGYDPANPPAVTFSGGGGSSATATATIYDGSYCTLPFSNITALEPVMVIAGNASTNFSGVTESGLAITPDRVTVNSVNYFSVPRKDLSASAANVYLGYKYNYDITLPKVYYQKQPGDSDFTAPLTISRMKFSVGQSSVVGFKLNRKGVQESTQSFVGDGSTTAFSPDFKVTDKRDVVVKRNGAKQTLVTSFSGTSDERKSQYTIENSSTITGVVIVTFGTAPSAAVTAANVTTAADDIEIYVDNWYTIQPTQEANYYLGDDVPLNKQSTFVVPIHQRTDNYTLRVFNDSPFPIALTAATWEGNYSPRYYRRT